MTICLDTRAAALAYARRGVPVLPVGLDKMPRVAGGFHSASTDEETVARWFSLPDVAIGARTGSASRLAVLDLDANHGDPAMLLDALAEVLGCDPPRTATSRTGGGGLHLFFRLSPGQTVRSSAGKLAPGADVRGEGGYIILPPSRHASGGRYRWSDEADDGIFPAVATAPADWLADLIAATAPSRPAPPPLIAPRLADASATWAADALLHVSASCDYDTWLRVGAALTRHPDGAALFDTWSATAPDRYAAEEVARKWASLVASPLATVSLGTLWHLAKANGWRPPSVAEVTASTRAERVALWRAGRAVTDPAQTAAAVARCLGELAPGVSLETWAAADLVRALNLSADVPPFAGGWPHLTERVAALVPTVNARGELVGVLGCSTLSPGDLAGLDAARPERSPKGSNTSSQLFADEEGRAMLSSTGRHERVLLADGAFRYLTAAGARAEGRRTGRTVAPLPVVGVTKASTVADEVLGALLERLTDGGRLLVATDDDAFASRIASRFYTLATAARRRVVVARTQPTGDKQR